VNHCHLAILSNFEICQQTEKNIVIQMTAINCHYSAATANVQSVYPNLQLVFDNEIWTSGSKPVLHGTSCERLRSVLLEKLLYPAVTFSQSSLH